MGIVVENISSSLHESYSAVKKKVSFI